MIYRYNDKKSTKSKLLLIIAVVLIITTLTGIVLAKYISSFSSEHKQADTASFCFLTDLAENTADNPYPVYDNSIDFAVQNYDELNTSQRDITYTVFLGEDECKNGTLKVETEGENPDPRSKDNISINVTNDSNEINEYSESEGKTYTDYTVKVVSNSPYSKTITLYFRAYTHYADSYYSVTTHIDWLELDIYTGMKDGDISVSYGSLKPDNTIELTKDWLAGESASGTIEVQPFSHYKLIFFGNYDNSFELVQNKKSISEGA